MVMSKGERKLTMRVKDAILAVMTQRDLKRVIDQLGISEGDDGDAVQMIRKLGSHSGATGTHDDSVPSGTKDGAGIRISGSGATGGP